MARLSTEKLAMLERAFTEDAMTPRQAAQKVGVTYATAKRWYEKLGGGYVDFSCPRDSYSLVTGRLKYAVV